MVASVSCIYNLGSPDEWRAMSVMITPGMEIERTSFLESLINIQYERNDIDFTRVLSV
ncbi:MAG: hypothetical protein R2741_06085 [Methanolobus sp.]